MTRLLTASILIAGMGLSACTNPDRFGVGDPGAADPGATLPGANGIDTNTLGTADPASPQYFQETVGDRVLFQVDQFTLTPEAQAILAAQARWLLDNPEYLVIVEGHADEQGNREYNLALGGRRANSVREYLVAQGVPASRIQIISYGKERPIAVCSDEACYAQNRRAVTVISIATLG